MRVQIKFCGFTRLDDFHAHLVEKFDHAGFVFAEKSRRFIEWRKGLPQWMEQVKAKFPRLPLVAVMAGLSEEKILTLAGWNFFEYFQYGESIDRTLDLLRQLKQRHSLHQPYWLAISDQSIPSVMDHKSELLSLGLAGFIYDSLDKNYYGGSGVLNAASPEKIALVRGLKDFYPDIPLFLAGGLKPENVRSSLLSWQSFTGFDRNQELGQVHGQKFAYLFDGVDVSSGIEASQSIGSSKADFVPVKDPRKMDAFIRALELIR